MERWIMMVRNAVVVGGGELVGSNQLNIIVSGNF